MFWRSLVVVLASLAMACGSAGTLAEPTPGELLQKASANLTNAKTAHMEGTGTFALTSGLSFSFDFKLNGDVEMPDKSRLTTQMSLLGQSLSVDTITVDGRTFSKGLMGGDWTETAANDPQGAVLDPLGQTDLTAVTSVTDFGVFVQIEEGVEGLIHVSQLSTERVDRPASLYKIGDEVEAEVTQVDAREKRIALSIKALKRSEEREEVDAYLRRERESGKFSFADVMGSELEARDKGGKV